MGLGEVRQFVNSAESESSKAKVEDFYKDVHWLLMDFRSSGKNANKSKRVRTLMDKVTPNFARLVETWPDSIQEKIAEDRSEFEDDKREKHIDEIIADGLVASGVRLDHEDLKERIDPCLYLLMACREIIGH